MSGKRVDWTQWDSLLGTIPDRELAKKIGCTQASVHNRRQNLGISSQNYTFVDWAKWDYLLGTITDLQLARQIGCTDTCVKDRRAKLGIAPKNKTHWSSEEKTTYEELFSKGLQKCNVCEDIKPFAEFDKNSANSSGLNRWCKPCKSKYQANKIEEKRNYWIMLAGGCCQHCGWGTWFVSLDFHHVNGDDKEWTPGKLIMQRPIGSEEVFAELDKCTLLCCNCHMAFHRGAIKLKYEKREGLGWTIQRKSLH